MSTSTTELRAGVPTTCPRCGKKWIPWAGSRLRTHAKCHFSPEEQDALLHYFEMDQRLTESAFAKELGVSTAVLRVTLAEARRRRGDRVPRP
jgi:hypothetical protein